MEDPNLLVPAIIAFSLMVIGLLLTAREFSSTGSVGQDPVDRSIEVVKPGSGQVDTD